MFGFIEGLGEAFEDLLNVPEKLLEDPVEGIEDVIKATLKPIAGAAQDVKEILGLED